MESNKELLERIHTRACLSRAFDEELYKRVELGEIEFPVYMSAGQEYPSAVISEVFSAIFKLKANVFIQHRGHATYLSFGGSVERLILEMYGDSKGCSYGMGGSASIQSVEANIYGHDGLMGSHGPIAVGHAFSTGCPTLCFIGDAAAEEDYFLAALGWAATKAVPIWFIVEDNNLSILTKKSVRRSWGMAPVAKAFGLSSYEASDDPTALIKLISKLDPMEPTLLNIDVIRKFWHAGAGNDNPDSFDRLLDVEAKIGRGDLDAQRTYIIGEWERVYAQLKRDN